MPSLRKANAYSKRKVTPYTRISKRKSKAYIRTVPPQKIVKFSMGKEKMFKEGKLPFTLTLVTSENIQIRSNALEACRQFINKKMDKTLSGIYYFKVIPFPHHVQRENKMLTGAGADRMQTGMQLSFGKSMNKAAIVKKGKGIFTLAVQNKKAIATARAIFKQVKAKLPCKVKFIEAKVE